MANGYVLFDDALAELSMSEEELKGLMEGGKLRHFMDAGKIKFRREDLDELKASRGIAEETPEEEITLAPPEDTLEEPEIPPLEGEEVPPPPPAEDEGFADRMTTFSRIGRPDSSATSGLPFHFTV